MKGKHISLFCVIAVLFIVAPALQAGTLTVTTKTQEHSNWCWDASCQMCFTNYSKNYSQCSIANYTFGRSDCCGNSTFYWNHTCNQGGTVSNMTSVLSAGGVSSSATYSYLSWTSVKSQIDTTKRPFIIGWYWTSGGGHAICGCGYRVSSGVNQVYYKDPWPGEGAIWASYTYVTGSSQHSWSSTIRCR